MQDILFFLKKYLKDFLFAFFICLSIALSCFCLFKNQNVENDNSLNKDFMANMAEEEQAEEAEPNLYHVDIKGAVKTPGVYEVEEGTIINDVIALAGGFSENAHQKGINLSKKVTDEMVIYIYTEQEVNASKEEINSTSESPDVTCNSSSYDISDCVEKSESIIMPADDSISENETSENTSTLININTASKSELTSLSGIGDVKAQAIIDYRTTNGNFKSIEDILNVSGIGDAIFAQIKDYITV